MDCTNEEIAAQKALIGKLQSAIFSQEGEVRSISNTLESRRRSLGALQMELVIETKILKRMEDSRGKHGKVGSVRGEAGSDPGGVDS